VGATKRWSDPEKDFATGVAQIVSTALAARAHTRAEAARRRAAFLETVSGVFSSLDARQIASRAVSLAVPKLAETSWVWIYNRDGVLECFACKHADPSKQWMLDEYLGHEPVTPLVHRVARQQQSLLIPEFSPSLLERLGYPARVRTQTKRLGLRSAMSVPLAVAGKTFGAMSFVSGDRRHDADDLALAENMGRLVASALENARLYEVAREAVRARDELLVLAAHELRTPVTALKLTTDHMLRRAQHGADTGETARSEKIARHARRVSALIEHVIEAMTIRAEGVTLQRGPCDLATILRERVDAIAQRARAAGSAIAVDSPPSLAGAWDRERLAKVIDVLLDNAVKFGGGKPIAVSLRADEATAELSVRDQGMGIPAARLPAIFDPFERAVPKEHFGGLGLGLYVAKAVVEAHRGAIAVTSQPDQGTTFFVRLPLRPAK
jgi:signal transduction histidine kinase